MRHIWISILRRDIWITKKLERKIHYGGHASLSTEIANIIVQGTPGALTGLVGELRGRGGNVSDEENDTIRRSRLVQDGTQIRKQLHDVKHSHQVSCGKVRTIIKTRRKFHC
jgi:hypothetical protein